MVEFAQWTPNLTESWTETGPEELTRRIAENLAVSAIFPISRHQEVESC
jgi:hypothetical protein